MHDLSIAQQIANKQLQRRKLIKLAQGHRPGSSTARPSTAAAAPAAAVKPITAGRRHNPSAVTRQNTRQKNPWESPQQSVGGAFVSGMGQGVKNMFGAAQNFGVGAARVVGGVGSSVVGGKLMRAANYGKYMAGPPGTRVLTPNGSITMRQLAENEAQTYEREMGEHAYRGAQDMFNSFGRFVGVYDAWDPTTGQYRGAQPANSTKQHTQEIGEKYFGDTRGTVMGRAYNAANSLGDAAAGAVPLAAAGPALGAQVMRIPGAASAARVAAENPLIRRGLTYGAGLPVTQPARPGLFLASNMGQNFALGAGMPGAEYLPANLVDTTTREVAGDFAPEVFDALRWGSKTPVALMAAASPVSQISREATQYGQEQNQIAADQQISDTHMPDVLNGGPAPAAQTVENQPAVLPPTNTQQSGLTENQLPAQVDPAAVSAAVQANLPVGTQPEQAQAAEEAAAAIVANPNKPTTPEEAQQVVQDSEGPAIEQLVNERMQENPAPSDNPRDWGQWFEETMSWATDAWNNLGFVGKLAFGLGMPLGIIGLLGGGLSGVLTAALGFGVAGLAAAGSGALGETAQGAVTGVGEAITGTGAPAAPVEPPEPLAQDESLKLVQELTAAPDGAQYIAQNRAKFDQFAAMSDADLSSVAQQMSPESRAAVNKILTGLKTQVDKGIAEVGWVPWAVADRYKRTRAKLDSVGLKSTAELPALQEKINRMLQVLNAAQQEVAAPTGEKNSMFNSKFASHIVAQHLAITTLQKAARCWSGYEPVPGKKPYSNDSCRPIGGKKKKKKDKAAK